MTSKIIKNEQWNVKQLITKINNQEISKPKFQRKNDAVHRFFCLQIQKLTFLTLFLPNKHD